MPATVTASLSDNFEGLLGMDFITTFNLKIDTARQVLVLTKPESNAKTPGGHHEHWWRRLFHQFKDQKKGWEGFRDQLDRRLAESQISEGASIETLRRVRAITDNQVQEAEKLQSRLERTHAGDRRGAGGGQAAQSARAPCLESFRAARVALRRFCPRRPIHMKDAGR